VAIHLFSVQGYNGVSMRNIADAVNLSAPALYNHFADKKSLYESAVAHNFEAKADLLQPVLKLSEPPAVRLQHFIERLCLQMSEDAEFRRLIQWELLNEDRGRLQYLAQDLFAPLFSGMMDLLKELKPEADAHLLAVIIIGMIQKPYEMNPLSSFLPGSEPAHQDPDYIARQVMNILSCFLGENNE
jgi:AcrR family transcriptional regulator